MKPIVLIPEPIAECGISLLEPHVQCMTPWRHGGESAEAVLPSSDAVIVRLFAMTGDRIAQSAGLKVIAKHGVGVDNIDMEAATRRRIPVVFTPAANINAVAEHTLALMLGLARHLHTASTALWTEDRVRFEGVELAGKTLGVIGLGRIGRRVAQMAGRGIGMDVCAYDPYAQVTDRFEEVRLERSLNDLLRASDFLSLHLPLNDKTRGLIDADRLRMVKTTCRLVNTSRGGVIDEPALADALRHGRLAGAALDVFEHEPLPRGHPFYSTPNLLLTPHVASSTRESLDRMAVDAARGVLDVLEGRKPAYPINPEAL